MSQTPEALLAQLVTDIPDEDIPHDARTAAIRQALDCVGVTLAAAAQPAGRIMREVTEALGGAPHARIIGSGVATSSVQAAFANGSLAHLLDFDDRGFSHPTACLLPVALAVGEQRDASGREVVAALVLGYEVFERLAVSARPYEPHLRGRGYHPTSIYGAPAAAAVAGRLLGLDTGSMVVAFGIAAAGATGLSQQFGTWAKGINAGNAARVGVTAALLAGAGYFGDEQGISGDYGLFSAVHGAGNYDFSGMPVGLGSTWAILTPGLALKPYPACTSNLRAVDSMASIVAEPGYEPELVREIRIDVHPDIFHTLRYRSPEQGFRGKFSLDYTVASMALDRDLVIESFSDASAARPELRDMLAKVSLVEHPDWSMEQRRRMPVTVTMEDGTRHERSVTHHRGSPEWPMTEDEVDAKFLTCATETLARDGAEEALKGLRAMDDAASIRWLVDQLVPAPTRDV